MALSINISSMLSARTVDEDVNNNGRIIAFDGEAGPNVVNPDTKAGSNQITITSDLPNPSFAGVTLKVAITSGDMNQLQLKVVGSTGVFSVASMANTDGSYNVTYFADATYAGSGTNSGSNVTPGTPLKAIVIGTLDGSNRGGHGDALVIHLNASATLPIVQTLAANIGIGVTDAASMNATQDWAAAAGSKTVMFSLTDSVGVSVSAQRTVSIVSQPDLTDPQGLPTWPMFTQTAAQIQSYTPGQTVQLSIPVVATDPIDAISYKGQVGKFVNGVFTTVGSPDIALTALSGALSGSIQVPADAPAGFYILRIYADDNTADPFAGNSIDVKFAVSGGSTVPDTTPPTLQSAAVNGSTLVLTFSEAIDAAHLPNSGAQVTANGAALDVTGATVSGATLTLTLNQAVVAGASVTFSYTDPTTGNDAIALQDLAGNDAASVSNFAVTNNTPTGGGTVTPLSFNTTGTINGTPQAGESYTTFGTGVGGVLASANGGSYRLDIVPDSDSNPSTFAVNRVWLNAGVVVRTDTGVLTFNETDSMKPGPETWSAQLAFIKTGELVPDSNSDGKPDGFKFTDDMNNLVSVPLSWLGTVANNVIATFTVTVKNKVNADIVFSGSLLDTNSDGQPDSISGSMGTDPVGGMFAFTDATHWQVTNMETLSGRVQSDTIGNPAGLYMSSGGGTNPVTISFNTTGTINGTPQAGESYTTFGTGAGGALATASNGSFRLDIVPDSDNNPNTFAVNRNWFGSGGVIVSTDPGVLTFQDTNSATPGPETWSAQFTFIKTGEMVPDGADADTLPDGFKFTDGMNTLVSVPLTWQARDAGSVIATFSVTVKNKANADIVFSGSLLDNNNDGQPDSISGSMGTDPVSGLFTLTDATHWQVTSTESVSGRVQVDGSGNPAGLYMPASSGGTGGGGTTNAEPTWPSTYTPPNWVVTQGKATPIDLVLQATDPNGDTISYTAVVGQMILGGTGAMFSPLAGVGPIPLASSGGHLTGSLTVPSLAASGPYVLCLYADDNPADTKPGTPFYVQFQVGTSGGGGGGGANTINGTANADTLTGTDAADLILAGAGNDTVSGGLGNDTLVGGAGDDSLDGGDGSADVARYTGNMGNFTATRATVGGVDVVTVTDNTGSEGTDRLTNIENLSFADKFISLSPQFNAGQGSAQMAMNNIRGTPFDDTINADALAGVGAITYRDYIDAGAGNDSIHAGQGGDQISGGSGSDWIDGGDSTTLARLNLALTDTWSVQNRAQYSGPAARYEISQHIDIDGSITGAAAGTTYYTVKDLRSGSPDGTDIVFNIDVLQFNDKAVLLTPDIWLNKDGLTQNVLGANLTGSDFDDVMGLLPSSPPRGTYDFSGSDYQKGGAGNDTIYGGVGGDTLRGDAGNDRLDGGANRAADSSSTWDMNGSNGVDVAEYSGNADRYSLTFKHADGSAADGYDAAGTVVVTDSKTKGGDGIDTLSNIEVLRFADGVKNLAVISSPIVNWVWDATTQTNVSRVTGISWTGTDWNDSIDSSASNLAVNVQAGAGDDSIKGGGGADIIDPGEGNDTVDGGANQASGNAGMMGNSEDIVRYDAPQNRFTITMTEIAGLRTYTVADKLSAEFGGLGTDTLTHIEALQFSDGSKELQVSLSTMGSQNYIKDTDFSDHIDAAAMVAAVAVDASAVVIKAGVQSQLDITLAAPTADGQKFIAVLGYSYSYAGGGADMFSPATMPDPLNPAQQIFAYTVNLTSNGGHLTGSYLFTNLNGTNMAIRVYAADAMGAQTGSSLGQFTVALKTDFDYIMTGAGDDVVYAGAGGDHMVDGTGNDFFDGGANGSSGNTWNDQDVVQFNGAQKRYAVDVLAYDAAPADVKALITAKYSRSDLPTDVIRVTDKLPGGDGVNYLINDEQIQFTDGQVNLGISVNPWMPPQGGQNNGVGSNTYTGGILNDRIDARAHDAATLEAPVGGFSSNRDWIDGGLGNDTLLGGAGGDQLQGGKGNDVLDGGDNGIGANQWDNLDRAVFSNSINRYDIQFFRKVDVGTGVYNDMGLTTVGSKDYVAAGYYSADGLIVVTDRYSDAMGGEGRDVLRNIEQLQFSDASETLLIQASDFSSPGQQWNPLTNSYDPVSVIQRNVWGTRFGDLIVGKLDGQNFLNGNAGNDLIIGGNLKDELNGGTGNDTLDGGANPAVDPTRPWDTWNTYDVARYDADKGQFNIQRLTDDAQGTVTGHADQVYYRVEHLIPSTLGGLGTDIVFNVERLQFSGANGDVQLEVRVDKNTYNGIDQAMYSGTMFADAIVGTSGNDSFMGDAGNDTIQGGDGNDNIGAGAGNDSLFGGNGDDQFVNLAGGDDSVDGGDGTDSVVYEDILARFTVELVRGGVSIARFGKVGGFGVATALTDTIKVTDHLLAGHGGEGVDTLANVEVIKFNDGSIDLATGVFATNPFTPPTNLIGTEGDDVLQGGAGNDTLDGGGDSATHGTNFWGGGDVAQYFGAPRARFEIIKMNGSFKVIDIASIIDPLFLPNGHLDPACYDAPEKVSTEVGYGIDTLINVERINFSDGQLDLAPLDMVNSYTSYLYVNGVQGDSYTVTRHNITGTFMDDRLIGSEFGDQIDGRGGNDTIDGGIETVISGNSWEIQDVVRYEGSRERYIIKGVLVDPTSYAIIDPLFLTGTEVFGLQVTDVLPDANGGSGTDLLVNVERVEFAAGSSSTGSNSIVIKPEYNYYEDWSAPLLPDSTHHPLALNARGTDFADALNGTAYSDWLSGNAGNDTLIGGAGGDDLEGGSGDDLILGGANGVADQWGNVRTDTARYAAPYERFEISSVMVDLNGDGIKETSALQVRDLLPADDSSSLGTDILLGIEALGFNNRWIDVGVRRSEWVDGMGGVTVNSEGTVFNDVISGDHRLDGSAAATRDNIRGNAGNDVLIGGANGDNLCGGEGNDVIDGGANGNSGNAWADQDTVQFFGNSSRYLVQGISISSNVDRLSQISVDGAQVATFRADTPNSLVIAPVASADTASLLQNAYNNLNLADASHSSGYLIADSLSADLGGDGTDLVFNVESLQFANGPLDLDIRANANDWNNDGHLDNVWVSGTSGNDTVTIAKLASLTGKSETAVQQASINANLMAGNDVYIGGASGDWVSPGAGNDYVDGGANSGTDQWGNATRDEVHFEAKFSRYYLFDVALEKSASGWTLSSSELHLSGASTTLLTAPGTLSVADLNNGIELMIDHAASDATQLSGWLVADRLPADFEGTGVDALVNVEALSFTDKWMPLSMQVNYNRDVMNPDPLHKNDILSANVQGTSGNDTIQSDGTYTYGGDDWIDGGAGNDVINAGAGGDWIRGGAGNDTIDGGANGSDPLGKLRSDTAAYSGNFDRYVISAETDGSGKQWTVVTDTDSSGDGVDRLINIETLSFSDRSVRLGTETNVSTDPRGQVMVNVMGSMMSDKIDVSGDAYAGKPHFINGNEGNDTLIGGDGPDQFQGGTGDDQIVGGANGVDAWGNPGFDAVNYDGMYSRYTVEIIKPNGTDASGNSFNEQSFVINGVTYSVSADHLSADGVVNDELILVRVTDSLSIDDGGSGADLMVGIEQIRFWDRSIALVASQTLIDVDGDGKPDASNMRGTDAADTLIGTPYNDHIEGGAGNDTISGGAGGDILVGGAGNDSLDGGADGVDRFGRPLLDVAQYSGNKASYTITAITGGYTVSSTAEGNDTLSGVEGLQFADGFVGLSVNKASLDRNADGVIDLYAIRGIDVVGDNLAPAIGDAANASYDINGAGGNDTLTGGSKDDVLTGGAGNDGLNGGGGVDQARYSGNYADYSVNTVGTTTTVTGGSDGTDTLINIEQLVFADQIVKLGTVEVTYVDVDTNGDHSVDQRIWSGTPGADSVTGAMSLSNVIDSGAGNDTLTGGNLADSFSPGAGSDSIDGGANQGYGALDVVRYDGGTHLAVGSTPADYAVKSVQAATLSFQGVVEAGDVFAITLGAYSVSYTAQIGNTMANVVTALDSAIEAIGGSSPVFRSVTHGEAGSVGTIGVEANSLIFGAEASVTNGVHAAAGSFSVYGANQTGSTLAVTVNGAVPAVGMHLSYSVTSGSSTSNYGAYTVTAVSGGTDGHYSLSLDQSMGASPADVAALTATVDNSDSSGAAGATAYQHWFEVSTFGETDVLKNIEQIVFKDGAVDLNPSITSQGAWGLNGLETIYKIAGTDFADILTSTSSNEIFRGGVGADHFVIADGNGQDQIRDFSAGTGGDVITVLLGANDVDGLNATGVDTVAELLARCSDQGGSTMIDLGGGNSLLLANVNVATLVGANFELVDNYY